LAAKLYEAGKLTLGQAAEMAGLTKVAFAEILGIVIADTSCFILLDKISELDLLQKVFRTVTTTKEIANEFNKPLPSWVSIKAAANHRYTELLEIEIDKGEASAIALALETDDSLLILDDQKARKLAEKLRLNYTGT
jgi:predicted nucleic acid-binding protein